MDATHSKRSRATQLDGGPERPKKRRVDRADVAITLTFVASAGLAAWGWSQEPPTRHSAVEVDRGRTAVKPSAIPLAGWKDILVRSYREIADDDVASIGQLVVDSTTGAARPLGLRRARVADTVASAQRGSILSAMLAKAPASCREIQNG